MVDQKIGAIIMAGGKSSRMGSDKGMQLLNGKPLVGYAIAALLPICGDIIISTNNADYEQFGFTTIGDNYTEIGPLGGLQAALRASKYQHNLVLSCDNPFVTTELLKKLAFTGFDNCCYLDQNKELHPLIGFYSKEIIVNIEFQIAKKNYKMMDLLELINCQLYSPSKAFLQENPYIDMNINTPEQLLKAEEILRTRKG